jgi:AraC-like DNA-binding protein
MAKMTLPASSNHERSSETHDVSAGEGRVAPDALSEVLQDLRLAGASYCRTEMRSPWGIEIPAEDGATLHFIVEGGAWLTTAGAAPLVLATGDVVLLPQGIGHNLVDAPGSPARPPRELTRERVGDTTFHLSGGGDGPRALLVCCGISFEASALHPLLRMMPAVLHVPSDGAHDPILSTLLDTMAAEVRDQRIGAATVMARLADIVVARVVRSWVEAQSGATAGWLAAIRDPQIGRALAAFHRSPERDWSVEALASSAGLSRSQFSERFSATLGVAPARYVVSWRMHLATRWLAGEQLSVGEIATRLGYDSEPSFSRAFKRIVGRPPGALRQRQAGKTSLPG